MCVLRHVQLCNPMDCSLPGSSVHGIFQARILEQDAISWPSNSTIGRRIFYHCETWEVQEKKVQKGQFAYSNPETGVNGLRSSLGICLRQGGRQRQNIFINKVLRIIIFLWKFKIISPSEHFQILHFWKVLPSNTIYTKLDSNGRQSLRK